MVGEPDELTILYDPRKTYSDYIGYVHNLHGAVLGIIRTPVCQIPVLSVRASICSSHPRTVSTTRSCCYRRASAQLLPEQRRTHASEVMISIFDIAQVVCSWASGAERSRIDERVVPAIVSVYGMGISVKVNLRLDDLVSHSMQGKYICCCRELVPDRRGVEVHEPFEILLRSSTGNCQMFRTTTELDGLRTFANMVGAQSPLCARKIHSPSIPAWWIQEGSLHQGELP